MPKPLAAKSLAFDKDARYPRSRIEKLGVKPGARVTLLGIDEPAFLDELKTAGADVSTRVRARSDIILVMMTSRNDLPRLVPLRKSIQPAGAVWVIWPKGRKEFREDDVRNFGPQAELVDVKVMAFSDTLSGLKMVVPLALRAPAQARVGVRRTPN